MKLISASDYILNIRGMITSELCANMPRHFKMPVWKGDKNEMVKDMLALDAIKWKICGEYAKFLKKPLELGFFIPTDKEGNVLEKPDASDRKYSPEGNAVFRFVQEAFDYDMKKYKEAQSRVIFEGFTGTYKANGYTTGLISYNGINIYLSRHGTIHTSMNGGVKETIEDLSNLGLEIKEQQIKNLGI